MKTLFTSALLTVVAVPFLMAAPKAQNATTPAPATTTAKAKVHKKAVKKPVASKAAPVPAPAK
jgi:hypothetical protein